MKLIVAGSRSFNDYAFLKEKLDHLLQNIQEDIEIISGTANGADKLGEQYAKDRGFDIRRFPADWDKYGKSAGYIRNEQMANEATHCVCFWDGKSKGTRSMIQICQYLGIPCRIIKV